jgi:hypothetical protein
MHLIYFDNLIFLLVFYVFVFILAVSMCLIRDMLRRAWWELVLLCPMVVVVVVVWVKSWIRGGWFLSPSRYVYGTISVHESGSFSSLMALSRPPHVVVVSLDAGHFWFKMKLGFWFRVV